MRMKGPGSERSTRALQVSGAIVGVCKLAQQRGNAPHLVAIRTSTAHVCPDKQQALAGGLRRQRHAYTRPAWFQWNIQLLRSSLVNEPHALVGAKPVHQRIAGKDMPGRTFGPTGSGKSQEAAIGHLLEKRKRGQRQLFRHNLDRETRSVVRVANEAQLNSKLIQGDRRVIALG